MTRAVRISLARTVLRPECWYSGQPRRMIARMRASSLRDASRRPSSRRDWDLDYGRRNRVHPRAHLGLQCICSHSENTFLLPHDEVAMRKFALMVVALIAFPVMAQEPTRPGPEHEQLKKREGNWESTMKFGDQASKG